jgi:hypothetical protein
MANFLASNAASPVNETLTGAPSETVVSSVNRIVLPAPEPVVAPLPIFGVPIFHPLPLLRWAPAWFYSALSWLGKSWYDASNTLQSFNTYMVGSEVDPYAQLGSTRLFVVRKVREEYFQLSLTANTSSTAPLNQTTGKLYPNTDAGIRDLYVALSQSSIFSAVNFCYIPGGLGADINPTPVNPTFAALPAKLQSGYDPATGLRTIVLGSAVSQVVPLNDFLATHNEQIYNDQPAIVPLVDALVYDVTQNNQLGATTFFLPTYYSHDQVSSGNYYVNKQQTTGSQGNATVHCGQTVIFSGGPGYVDSSATALALDATSQTNVQGQVFTSYAFQNATVITNTTFKPRADLGVLALTCSAASPLSAFANQCIIGYYRDNSWQKSLGVPIYDYGSANSEFTSAAAALAAPTTIYDPTTPFLNGGTLQHVVGNLTKATYLWSTDSLVSILDTAIAAKGTTNGAALSITDAGLNFDMTSTPAAGVVDQLTVPIVATITTTPPVFRVPIDNGIAKVQEAAAKPAVEAAVVAPLPVVVPPPAVNKPVGVITNLSTVLPGVSIGNTANNPILIEQNPIVVQVGLNAFIPQEALTGTGITNIEIGTAFAQQSLGAGATLQTETQGVVINLTQTQNAATSAPNVYQLQIASSGVTFTAGVTYILSVTGSNLSVRGSDGSTATSLITQAGTPGGATYVGAMVYTATTTTVASYQNLQVTLAAPAIGTSGVMQGAQYCVRLTIGANNSQYDLLDANQLLLASSVIVPTPAGSRTPQPGSVYFGSFIGGAAQMTLLSVPIFLTVVPSQLTGAGFNGGMTLSAVASGTPNYALSITDSSLFVYSNINVDTSAIGLVSSANVFLASAVINSAPDNTTSAAFAPCHVLMGLVRQAQMGTVLKYVFVPEDDSVVIGSTRYMLSVINMEGLAVDPNSRPYPPVYWPQNQYWQFANRHNPYLDVRYTGATEAARISQAQADVARIGLATAQTQEPMQMYLDTSGMIVWPIYEFPYDNTTQAVDQGQLKVITNTILNILNTTFPPVVQQTPGPLDGEQIIVPGQLQQNNPYTADTATTVDATTVATTATTTVSAANTTSVSGALVTNLNTGGLITSTPRSVTAQQSIDKQQAQVATASLAITKALSPQNAVTQDHAVQAVASEAAAFGRRQFQPIYGFSVYNPGTGEAYLIELVDSDLAIPDQLPDPTQNVTYDPYYVRVVFLSTLTAYNMTIIVPSMVHDQYGNWAYQDSAYTNVLSKTNELSLGYMYSLYDGSNNFDNLDFSPYPAILDLELRKSQSYIFTNMPYSAKQTAIFNPGILYTQFASTAILSEFGGGGATLPTGGGDAATSRALTGVTIDKLPDASLFDTNLINFIFPPTPPACFVCRRLNWNTDCHLMQATNPTGTSIYVAYGGGDLVPFRLDAPFAVDKRQPAHMYALTHTFADHQYDAVQTISVANKPYIIGVTTNGGTAQYTNLSIDSTAGTADLSIGTNQILKFPTECYIAGQASSTLTTIDTINTSLGTISITTGSLVSQDSNGNQLPPQFQLLTYNNLVYMVRAVSNVASLSSVGGLSATSGLLIDTFVPTQTGNLKLAQAARYKRSGLSYFGTTYTPTTMVDTLDTLDFTDITGNTFYVPTIFIPIPELDAGKGFIADLSNFLGQQIWTFVYPEIVATTGATVNGVNYPNGFNLDLEENPVLSLQKLHFVYDPIAVLFTTNDLAHKYPLQPKQQILALTNGQIQEGICWRSANPQPYRNPPTNICAQQILPTGDGMDRPNIVYSSHNRPVTTPLSTSYMGMSVNSFQSVSGVAYKIEESMLQNDQVGLSFVSAVSSTSNLLIVVLFDYNNNDLGTLSPYDSTESTKGLVFLNGYLSAAGYTFSSPDHFDVNDVLPAQIPLFEQITGVMGQDWDISFYNSDMSLPRQYWSLAYDSFTAPGLPNYIPNVPPALVDPTFTNRTRSLILSIQNPVRPQLLGLMDTYSSVVSCNLHLQNGVTGSVFLSKKADRDVASIGSNPTGTTTFPLYGLPTKYDFFIFSRDHYWTLKGASFDLIDQGYAMCLVDDGTGTGTKVASYSIDSDGNYYELYTYVLYSPNGGVLETQSFPLKVTLGAPASLGATPPIPETPNNVNPQDLVAQINKLSNLIYAAMGPSSPGQPPAYIPIQSVGGSVQAAPILGAPGFNGYTLNVLGANHQPVQISQIYSGSVTYQIAGSTTIVPFNTKSQKSVPFYGSLSNGLDKQVSVAILQSKDLTTYIPRPTVPAGPSAGLYGGDGLGALIGTPFSCAFQGSGAIPPAVSGDPTPGATMKADDSIFYTFNGISNSLFDSTGKTVTATGTQYFIDTTDPANPIYGVITLPKFVLNANTCSVNLSTTLTDGVTSRYTIVFGGKSYQFGPNNAHVTADRTTFTFNPLTGGIYTVSYQDVDAPAGSEAPSPITITPFSIAAGGLVNSSAVTVDVFNNPGGLTNMVLGVIGRTYTYDPVHGTVTITAGTTTTTVPLQTGLAFTSNSGYGYVIGFANGQYTVNASPMFPYSASTTGSPASYALMTSPQMFTLSGNFYTFNQDQLGNYQTVTGNSQTYPINPYQFSINGTVYIMNTNVQPNTVVGGGNVYSMTAGNTQFLLNGVQYTIALKGGSLNGATISGQFNITQANVVVLENYVYKLDTLNGQIVGNGTLYPLTTSGFTYTITTANQSFTVTTQPNATTVNIGNVEYLIGNNTVVGDSITYPILSYRTFVDAGTTYSIGLDGTVSVPPPFTLSGTSPWTRSTFTDSGTTYTVNDVAAFDGIKYYLLTGTPPQITTAAHIYTFRTDGVSIAAGPSKTYIVNSTGPLSPNQFTFGSETIFFGRSTDVAAFDGQHYFAITNNQFTDADTGLTYTLSGNTAVNQGNSFEIFSNLGATPYFTVPSGATYFVNVSVADTGSASGNIYSVFPISGGQFTIPLQYTITVAGSTVTVAAVTLPGGSEVISTLTASGGKLTGGEFTDPVTGITYICVINAGVISFVDSNNAVYPFPAPGATDVLVASVVVSTAVTLAVDNESPAQVYPVLNNQFLVGTTTFSVNVPVAYTNAAAGPYYPMVNGRFIVPETAPKSSLTYTVRGANVLKGYLINNDDEFSADGNTVYTVNDVNIVKSTNLATLSGTEPNQTLTAGSLTYALNTTTSQATLQYAGLDYNTTTKQFTVNYNGLSVTYTVGAASVTDNRHPANTFPATVSGSQLTFTDTVSSVTFSFNDSGNNPISAAFVYTNHFFVDVINGATYYIDVPDNRVEALAYLPETTQYAFVPADGNTYLIHYNDVSVVFPVITGANVDVGVATVGSDTFSIFVDQVDPTSGAAAINVNTNSFEINGNLYTITGTPAGADYSACSVVGDATPPKKFLTADTFQLTDPTITYTLQLGPNNQPSSIVATFPVKPSRDILNVNDDVYIITYNTVSTGSLLGQGQASIAITNSGFTLTNSFDTTKAKFIFDDLNIYDAGSVVGQFTAYLSPTFFIGAATYTLDPVNLVVTDNNKRPLPLLPNPTMFSISGANYVIDVNQTPHAIVGNSNTSPLSTDVTVVAGQPLPNSTFTLGGLIYKYTEDSSHNLLTITGTKLYTIAQPAQTFKLDSSLIFTIVKTPPTASNYPGTTVPIGTITAGTTILNLYAGTPESGGADFFTYKNVLYTMVASEGVYVAVQKSYTIYGAHPTPNQQQLAVFNFSGNTYLVTDGTTAGATTPTGINRGSMWAATSISNVEVQFGLVYGFATQPTSVTQSPSGVFQFMVTNSSGVSTLYDIVYAAGSNANIIKVDVPSLLPSFTQAAPFTFVASDPLTFETGGYNAFITSIVETAVPSESYAAAWKAPVVSTDSQLDNLIGTQGDFSVEFWHSLPIIPTDAYHPFTYIASTSKPLVYYVDVDFENNFEVYLGINGTVMQAVTTPPVMSSGWRHFSLTYEQPYTILCKGSGFEVSQASNYNFNRDFSIAMTFSASDVNTTQGLLYKGTGSDNTSPELDMSYRVGISNGAVTLQLFDGSGNESPLFLGPTIQANQYYQVIIVKNTATPTGNGGSTDPYASPLDPREMGNAASSGMNLTSSGFPSGGGAIKISGISPADSTSSLSTLLNNLSNSSSSSQSYNVTISVRTVNADGTFGSWNPVVTPNSVGSNKAALTVNSTGSAHLLIGSAYDDSGQATPLGGTSGVGNIRDVYLFSSAINREGINTNSGIVDIASATQAQLNTSGLLGYWVAAYDPNGVVNNSVDPNAVAISLNAADAYIAPLAGHELEGTSLYINGYSMPLTLVTSSAIPPSMQSGYTAGSSLLNFNAGFYKLQEISVWTMTRQSYQVIDDMFGRIVTSNEPFLAVYLPGGIPAPSLDSPILPMKAFIDNIGVSNDGTLSSLVFSNSSLDLSGCPCVAVCGPLITPNLYTPPGVALALCDTVPSMTTYSVTLNSVTGTLAGEINEAYVFVKNNVLTIYAGKKVGDLVLSWVSQEQGDVQVIGYVEGAPPAPMANLTNKSSYAGATSVTLSAPTSVTFKYSSNSDISNETRWDYGDSFGIAFNLGYIVAPFGIGVKADKQAMATLDLTAGSDGSSISSNGSGGQTTASNKLDESNKYTVKLQATLSPYTNDQFMSALNTLTTPSMTAGNPSSKTAILPSPNLGGFTTSNPPAALPKTAPTEEKFGQRMYVPSPYGTAFVTSETLDVYQQTLLQTNTVYGFVRVPDPQIPRDLNIVTFRINSKYLRPGVLDGVIGYAYNPAALPTGAQTYTTSTGQMTPVYDGNFSPGEVGHDASYMRVVEAYQIKKEIDQQAYNALALYQTAFNTQDSPFDSSLTPGLDFYNEYVWSSRGGTQEVKHTYTTSFDNIYTTTNANSADARFSFNLKFGSTAITVVDFKLAYTMTTKGTFKYSYNNTATQSFDLAASFDGIDPDTQMRYASNNDAHFVMNFNSMFNPNNQSGLNLVIGSDGLIYQIVPSVTSGAGLPLSNNIDTNQTYTQPQPAYTTGNADGLTGALEPYDRPGKTNLFRTYAFFLQPAQNNSDDFWNTVIDPIWLANSPDPDAAAMRSAQGNASIPWRLLYRVTYSERFLPPISTEAVVTPQITPVMAVPILNPASDFLFNKPANSGPAHNPGNDIEANVVLCEPTASGLSAGTVPTTGPNTGVPILPNNVIPFDLFKTFTTVANWGDTTNAKLLTQVLTSALGLNTVLMSESVLPGASEIANVLDPVSGGVLYTIYLDPNGLTVNVPTNFGISVYQDVNGNPIQYYDGKLFHSLQADYVATTDGTVMYYIQPPSTYDQSTFSLLGDYDVFGHPGDEWRYYLVSGISSNMTGESSFSGITPFSSSSGAASYTGFTLATQQHTGKGVNQVQGYVLVQGILQWPNLSTNAEVFSDVLIYKAMSLLDTFPIGDPDILMSFLTAQYPNAPFVTNAEINLVFAKNIVSFFNSAQQALLPQ